MSPTITDTAASAAVAATPEYQELCFGNIIAIVKTQEWNDHGRVSVLTKNLPDEPDLKGKFYVSFDADGRNNRWWVLDENGRIKERYNPRASKHEPALVNFGDTITLGLILSNGGATNYLSCRDDKRVAPDGTLSPDTILRRIGITTRISDTERWTIVDPSAPDSTATVRFDRPFALKSKFGDYLSQNMYGDHNALKTPDMYNLLRTHPRLSKTEKWIVGYPIISEGKPLRYQSMLSIVRQDDQGFGSSRLSAPADIGTATGNVVFDKSASSDSNRWTIVSALDSTADHAVGFGDTVYLCATSDEDPANPLPRYLSYRKDRSMSGGGVAVTVVPAPAGWERWKIVDPDKPQSVEKIRYGDKFELQGLAGGGASLSSRDDTADASSSADAPSLIVGVASSTAGQKRTWTVGDPVTELKGVLPTSEPFAAGPNNSALLLTMGRNLVKQAVVKGVGLIPEVGETIGGVVDFVWTEDGPDIWSLIKDRVKALVKDMIEETTLDQFILAMKGLNDKMASFAGAQSADERRVKLQPLLNDVNDLSIRVLALPHAQQTLPYVVAVANIHLTLLHERFVRALEYFPDTTPSGVLSFHQELRDTIKKYTEAVRTKKAEALQWRKDLVTSPPSLQLQTNIRDPYLRGLYDFHYKGPSATGSGLVNLYKERVADAFGSQLDAIMVPCLLWRYLDPDDDSMPKRKTGTLITGPYGKGYGGNWPVLFWNEPGEVPISRIDMRAGEEIYMFQINGGNKHGTPNDSLQWLELKQGERFVAAYGRHGWTCNSLSLQTNKKEKIKINSIDTGLEAPRSATGGGTSGDEWSAVLPAETKPFLIGLSGAAGDRLNQLYLHWRYERWE